MVQSNSSERVQKMEVMPNFQFQVCGRKVTNNVREREFSSQMAAKILEHEQAEKFQF